MNLYQEYETYPRKGQQRMHDDIVIKQYDNGGNARWTVIRLVKTGEQVEKLMDFGTWRVLWSDTGGKEGLTSVHPENLVWLYAPTSLILGDSLLVRGRDFAGKDDTNFNKIATLFWVKKNSSSSSYLFSSHMTKLEETPGQLHVGHILMRSGPITWQKKVGVEYDPPY